MRWSSATLHPMDQGPSGFISFAKSSISEGALAEAVSDVLVNDFSTVELLCQTKGGWEGWLQGALSIHLTRGGYDVQREVRAYGDRRAADLVIGDACVIELKALGLARDIGPFFDDVDVDVAKLQSIDGTRFGVVVVPGFSPQVFAYAQRRLKDFTRMRLPCSDTMNLYVLKVRD